MVSVWQESIAEHETRLSELAAQAKQSPEYSLEWQALGYETPDLKYNYRGYCKPDLERARKCLEYQAAATYGIKTRLRSWQDFGKAGISDDASSDYQDARLALKVRFDAEAGQFVPMTVDEIISEFMEQQQRHAALEMREQFSRANADAAEYCEAWAHFRPCNQDGPILYRRGAHGSFYKETAAGHSKVRTAAEDWQPGYASLLIAPRCTAEQVTVNKREVLVTLYDGEEKITSWVDGGPPTRQNISRGVYGGSYQLSLSHEVIAFNKYKEAIGFLPASGELYVSHFVGRTGQVPGMNNVVCTLTLDAAEFVAALKHGVTVASRDATRPILCTVLLTVTPDGLKVVSTDTYRLLVQDLDIINQGGELPDVMLPVQFCSQLALAMKKPVGEITLRIGERNPGVYCAEVSGRAVVKKEEVSLAFLTPCVEGQFLKWQKVIPASFDTEIVLDGKTTAKALEELADVAREDANRVRVEVDHEGLYLYSDYQSDHGGGRVHGSTACGHLGVSDDLSHISPFALNFRYACDYLSWQKEPVTLGVNSPLSTLGFTNCRSRYLLMPMQII